MRPLKMGVVGFGVGASAVLPTMIAIPEIELVAGADHDPALRAAFRTRYPQTRVYDDLVALCDDPDVEAIWISTPNRYHCEHAIEALRRGKHVAVEKPMAVTLEEADRMVETAERYGVKLMPAHTSSYQLPIRAMRRLAMSGEIGSAQAISIASYTDWMLRPRSAEELATTAGSGIVHRQAPHQIDTLRLLGGGRLRSVRGTARQWMKERSIPGFFTAYLEFEDGLPATILHNGHGYFMTLELYPWGPGIHYFSDEDRVRLRQSMRSGQRDEEAEKQASRVGGRGAAVPAPSGPRPWSPIDLGMLILSCERGDVRHSQFGLTIYGDAGRRELDLRPYMRPEIDLESGATIPALLEFRAAILDGRPLYHDGAWGRATLEATIAIVQSSRERREIVLERQVAIPEDYDAELFGAQESSRPALNTTP
jgi:phthalate 4,5-cis-dihydrodiol dehydrogenase